MWLYKQVHVILAFAGPCKEDRGRWYWSCDSRLTWWCWLRGDALCPNETRHLVILCDCSVIDGVGADPSRMSAMSWQQGLSKAPCLLRCFTATWPVCSAAHPGTCLPPPLTPPFDSLCQRRGEPMAGRPPANPPLFRRNNTGGEGWEGGTHWLDKQPPGPGQLFQITRRKKNLLIRLAVQLGPCGIVAQTLPALCYTTHKVAQQGSERKKVKEGV